MFLVCLKRDLYSGKLVENWIELIVRCVGFVRNDRKKGVQLNVGVGEDHNERMNEKTEIFGTQGLRLRHRKLLVLTGFEHWVGEYR